MCRMNLTILPTEDRCPHNCKPISFRISRMPGTQGDGRVRRWNDSRRTPGRYNSVKRTAPPGSSTGSPPGFTDHRDQRLVEHSVRTLVAQRITGIALGYDDLNDYDDLRRDPLLALLSGNLEARRKGCAPLAGKSTLSRLEHALASGKPSHYSKIDHDPEKLQDVLVESFVDSCRACPHRRLVLDIDSTDVAVHGRQDGRFYLWLLTPLLLPAAVHHPWRTPALRAPQARQRRHRWRGGPARSAASSPGSAGSGHG